VDWSNERYVRLYTRDSVTWSLWPWEARALFCFLLRKVDRAGVLDLGDNDPARAVAAVVSMPLSVVKEHLPSLVESGAIEIGTAMVMPNYIEAQEAKSSDKQRQSESRGRRRDRARAGAAVTPRDKESHPVTDSHTESHRVTPSLAEPSQTMPSNSSSSQPSATTPPLKPQPPEAVEIAQYLYDAIRSHMPGFRAKWEPARLERALTSWANDIRLAMEQDGATVAELRTAIDVAHRSTDPFWRGNLLSGKKLREHREKLLAKAAAPQAKAQGRAVPKAPKMDYQAASKFWRPQ